MQIDQVEIFMFTASANLASKMLHYNNNNNNNNNNNKIFIYPDKKPISQSRDWLVLTGDQH